MAFRSSSVTTIENNSNNKQQLAHIRSCRCFFIINRFLILILVAFSLIRLVIFTRKVSISDYLPAKNNYGYSNVSLVDLLTNQTNNDNTENIDIINSNDDNKLEEEGGEYKYNNSNNEDEDDFHSKVWPTLRHVLCGKGSSNLMLARTLFALAREEVFQEKFVNKTFRSNDGGGGPTNTLTNFFVGDFGTSIYHRDATNPNLTTVYARIWKCGNNQIRWMEKKLWLNKQRQRHHNGTYIPEMPLWQALGNYLYTKNITDGTYTYNSKVATTNKNTNNIAPPCIYTVIRDPISHFLSGFNEVEVRILGEYNNGTSEYNMKNEHLAPYHTAVPYSNSSSTIRRRRFSAFVEDLLQEEEAFSKHYMYSHFFSMSRILAVLAKYNLSLTGYIPSLENITSTWPAFISSTCPGAPPIDHIPKMTIQGQHRSSKDRLQLYKAAKDVWEEGGPIARSLCILHAFDYACYENLPDGIPELCIKVYTKHAQRIIEYGSNHYYSYDN